MLKENEKIIFKGVELIEVLKQIEIMVISFDKLGAYYGSKHYDGEDIDHREYEKESARFFDECRIANRLSQIRTILSEPFDDTRGEDDMYDLERAMEGLTYWRVPGDILPDSHDYDFKEDEEYEEEDYDTEI